MVTHGSVTQAGKVRSITPKIPAKQRKGVIPRVRNRSNFRNRLVLRRESGQQWVSALAPRPRM